MHPLPNKACTDLFHIVVSVIKAKRGATVTCHWRSLRIMCMLPMGGMTTTHRHNLKNSRLKILFLYKDKKRITFNKVCQPLPLMRGIH